MVHFETTLWSVVLRARDPEDPHHRTALARLCEAYWPPVYAYLRWKGHPVEEAQDATQEFFAHILEKGIFERVETGRGRFRSYLLAVLEHFLANRHRVARAEKRGGGRAPLSFDFQRAESDLAIEPVDPVTPEDAFRRSWALGVLEDAFESLSRDFEARGVPGHFEALRDHLLAAGDRATYGELAERLGVSVTDVTNLLHRCRKRLREAIRERLGETVATESDLEAEIRELFETL